MNSRDRDTNQNLILFRFIMEVKTARPPWVYVGACNNEGRWWDIFEFCVRENYLNVFSSRKQEQHTIRILLVVNSEYFKLSNEGK